MQPMCLWLGKFGYKVCRCKNCKKSRFVRNKLAPKSAARQQVKLEIKKDLTNE